MINKSKLSNQLTRFLNAIHKEYFNAKQILVKARYTKRVIRGRGRSISSITEDLFAKLLCRIFKSKNIIIFVDQPVSLVEEGQVYYPDIIITKKLKDKKFEILYMLDLKMDIGWHRNTAFQHPKKLEECCDEMKNSRLKAKLKNKLLNEKNNFEFYICDDASYDMVIVSSRNSGNPKNESKLLKLSSQNNKNLWVLSYGSHPNRAEKKIDIKANFKDWMALVKKINKVLKNNL